MKTCYNCSAKIKSERYSTHVWIIEYECGGSVWGALDSETHGECAEIYNKCLKNKL